MSDFRGVAHSGGGATVENIRISGLTTPHGGDSHYGVIVACAPFTQYGKTVCSDFAQAPSPAPAQSSYVTAWPQSVALHEGADDVKLGVLEFRNVVSGLVIGSKAGTYEIEGVVATDLIDNALYATGGSGSCGFVSATRCQEPIVQKGGTCVIGNVLALGHCIRVIGLDRAQGDLIVNAVQVSPDGQGDTPKQIAGLREGNEGHTCPNLRIGYVSGSFKGFSVLQFSNVNGGLEKLSIGGMDVTMNFHGEPNANTSYFMELTGVAGVSVGPSRIKIVDRTSGSTSVFRLRLGALTRESVIDSLFVDCLLPDGNQGAHTFRGENYQQAKLDVYGANYQKSGTTAWARERAFGQPNSINGTPQHTAKPGVILWDKTPTPGSSYFQSEDGTNGTLWRNRA